MKTLFTICLVITLGVLWVSAQDIPSMMGGIAGNTNRGDETFINSFSSSNVSGVSNPRISAYPNRYWDGSQPTPETLDDIVINSHGFGQELVFYFIHDLDDHGDPGDYNKWYAIGQSFATRFGKNSAWLASQGFAGRGSTTFMAFNEPWHNSKDWDPEVFKACMDGFGDGVHSVNQDFEVTTGGMPTYLLPDRNPLVGAITPLLNDGTLDGLTLHFYNNTRGDQFEEMNYSENSQAVFDALKSYWGITADISFSVTEYMPKADEEEWKSKYFLMQTWSHLGVIGNEGQPVARHIAPYLYTITTADHDQFSMAEKDWLWQGNGKGRVYQMVSRLAQGMNFVSADPRATGEYVLEGNGRRLIVWQNAETWTNHPGNTFTINDIPSSATRLEVFKYDSWSQPYPGNGGTPSPYQSINLWGESSYTVNDLPTGECYMFMIYLENGSLNAHPEVAISNIQEGQVFKEGEQVEVIANVVDVDSEIEEVRFFLDRSFLEVKQAAPYTITVESLPVGSTEIIVTARDVDGGFNVSTVNVVVEPDGEFVRATHDTYVRGERNAEFNYGEERNVELRANPNKLRDQFEGYFQFDLTALDYNSVDSAYLFFRVNRKGIRTIDVNYVADDNWDESTLIWNNKPEIGDKITEFDPVDDGSWSRMEVTDLINGELNGDKVLSLMLLPQSGGLDTKIYSSESSVFNAAYIELKRISIEIGITSPGDSAEFEVGSDVFFEVSAIDTASSITKVEFFQDTMKLGEATTAPYTVTWENPPAGNYLIKAVATNAEGDTKADEVLVKVVDPDLFFLQPIEDTYVRRGNVGGDVNYGDLEVLTVKQGGPNFQFNALTKFDLSEIQREVINATLRLYAIEDDNRGGDPDHRLFSVTDDSWEELVVTWDTKPATYVELAGILAPNLNEWIEYEVTDYVNNEAAGDDLVSFLMNASNKTEIVYASRENSRFAIRPLLTVTTLPEPPQAPSITLETYSDTQINVSWTEAGGKIDGFTLERKADTTDVYTVVGSFGPDESAFVDSTLTCETSYTYRIKAYNAGGESDYSMASGGTRLCPNGNVPYGGIAWAIPGEIEAEDFDEGGQGIAYNDRHPRNIGRSYRTSEGVDVFHLRNGGHAVGWTWTGEWLEYTVEVTAPGEYEVAASVASWSSRGKFHIEVEGTDVTGVVKVPRTWGWTRFRTVSAGQVYLGVGKQIIRLYIDRGLFNIDKMTFTLVEHENARLTTGAPEEEFMDLNKVEFQVFPNPAQDIVVIAGSEDGILSVFDINGKQVLQRQVEPGLELDISDLKKGIYLFQIQSSGQMTVQRVIKE